MLGCRCLSEVVKPYPGIPIVAKDINDDPIVYTQRPEKPRRSATFSTLLLWLLSAAQFVFRQWVSCSEGIASKGKFTLGASLVLAENVQGLINEDSQQPASKLAFVFELWRIPRCCQPAVVDRVVGSLGAAKNPGCNEVKQPVTAREPRVEYDAVLSPSICDQEIVRHSSPDTQSRQRVPAHTVENQKWIEDGNSLSSSLQWQRYGRGKNSFGIKEPFDSLQPAEVATEGLRRLFVFLRSQHVGITSRQRMRRQVLG